MRNNYFPFIAAALLFLQTPYADAATEITGTITAKRGDLVKVEFQPHKSAGPKVGDEVKFSYILSGFPVSAGTGKVAEVTADSVWIKPVKPNLKLKMDVVIHATGIPVKKKKREVPDDNQQSASMGSTDSVDIDPSQQASTEKHNIWREPTTGMEFVYIPYGCFQMGSSYNEKGRNDEESPLHEVCVDGFWMGRYEVSNRQYRQFRPSHDSKLFKGRALNNDDQPVVHVNWVDADQYASWLSDKSGKKMSLPTEAQWEYAARGNTSTAHFWGNSPDPACQYANVHDLTSKRINEFDFTHHNCDDGQAVAALVGKYKPNSFGLYDMLGNVSEWCLDWYDKNYYKSSPRNNPLRLSGQFLWARVLRGGNWRNSPKRVRSAHRSYFLPGPLPGGAQGGYAIGFRLVLIGGSR